MIRAFLLGLAVFCAGLTLGATTVHAQEVKKLSNKDMIAQNKREQAMEESRERGMKMAPAMIAGQKLYCTLADARFVTTGKSELNGKQASTDFVEVACDKNLGYVIGARKDGGYVAYDCIETSVKGADGKPSPLRCTLPANNKPFLGLQTQLTVSGNKCTISNGAYVGMTATASVYEVGCSKADGLLLTVATPRTAESAIKAVPCYLLINSDRPCALTKPEQSAGFITPLAQKAPKPCAASGHRFVGKTKAGESFYEFACPDGSGFMVQADASGAFMRDITCEQAKPLGGCTLTGATATAAAPKGTTPSAF